MTNKENQSSFLKVLGQYFISPLLVLAIGFYFNVKLEKTKQDFQKLELELKRIEASQKMISELFSGIPERAFVAERLITKILDKELGEEIRRIVENYYTSDINKLLEDNKIDEIEKIASAAEAIGSEAGKRIVENMEDAKFHIVVASILKEDEAIKKAKQLSAKGYESEVYLSIANYHAITLGKYSFSSAVKERKNAISKGDAPNDSWISRGERFTKKVYP